MVKKKVSGQTIAIIILSILLLATIVFGGVFAVYTSKSSKISGRIVMANLNIGMFSRVDGGAGGTTSEKSEIVISNGTNIMPNQPLQNSPLIIRNASNASIYLIVVYKIEAENVDTKEKIEDGYERQAIDIGVRYVNPTASRYNSTATPANDKWIDYVFTGSDGKKYRCFVSTSYFDKTDSTATEIEVIGENKLKLSHQMNEEYMNSSISFTFQAYAIGKDSITDITNESTVEERCSSIVSKIYEAQGGKFLSIYQ